MKRFSVVCMVTLVLAACSDPHDKVLPQDLSAIDQSTKDAIARLPVKEKELLLAYELRHAAASAFNGAGGVPPGTTIGDAINDQRQWAIDQQKKEGEEAAIKAQLKKAHDDAVAKLQGAVTGTLLQVSFSPHDFEANRPNDLFLIHIAFSNKSDKPISGIKGVAMFNDMFGDLIMRSNLTTDKTIQPGKTLVWNGVIDYNQFLDSDVKLRNSDPDKIKFDFEPEVIVFADGSKLDAPDDGE